MKTPPKDLSAEDVQKLLEYYSRPAAAIEGKYKMRRNLTMILLMLDSGLRVGELVQLRWNNLIFRDEVVTQLIVPALIAKTKVERTIPLTERAQEAIRVLWNLYKLKWPRPSNKIPFYGGCCHKPLTIRQVERIIGLAGEMLTGNRIAPHQLRHTFATRMLRITNIRVIQQLLGHKRLSSTQIYTHVNQQDLKEAIGKLNSQNSQTPDVQN